MSTQIDLPDEIVVPIRLPRSIIGSYIASQQEREMAGLYWQTLEQYVRDPFLNDEIRKHQKRVMRREKAQRQARVTLTNA